MRNHLSTLRIVSHGYDGNCAGASVDANYLNRRKLLWPIGASLHKGGEQAVIIRRAKRQAVQGNTPGAAHSATRRCAPVASRQFRRAIWRQWSGYYRWSRVATKMRCFKGLGERIVSRDFESQIAQLHIRARFSTLHRAWHARHATRSMSLSREMEA
jgi:hypothetical protein